MGYHQTTFAAVSLSMPEAAATYAAYFDTCRRKRNKVDYDVAGTISEIEADELVEKVRAFHAEAERWIAVNHPTLTR